MMKPSATALSRVMARWLTAVTLSIALITVAVVRAEPPPSTAAPVSQKKEPKKKIRINKLSGPELYAMHCNRCHPERYGPERTEAQWQTILLHMRIRANLPADQARAILKFLQEDSGK